MFLLKYDTEKLFTFYQNDIQRDEMEKNKNHVSVVCVTNLTNIVNHHVYIYSSWHT